MAEHRHDERVARSPGRSAPSSPRGIQAEVRMDARDDVVEPFQHVVGEVERPVGEDVALGPLEDPELAAPSFSFRASISSHWRRTRSIGQAAGVSGRSRVVGDPQVASGRGPLAASTISGEGGPAVAPVGVAVERSGQVVRSVTSRGSGPCSARSNLALRPRASRAGCRPGRGRAKRSASVAQGIGPLGPSRAYSLSLQTALDRAAPHGDVVGLGAGEVVEREGELLVLDAPEVALDAVEPAGRWPWSGRGRGPWPPRAA